ncbi:MAG: large conductance mechanosensitive channel protein [Candidatus Angelobacter sp.]|jgi:large conductance mechanosensitive channel|nr:large conductance mechanosensitive channel protein [Candidatus Angelobacter sp.]
MYHEFKAFLQKYNVMALAIAFILGAAIGKVVSALVADMIMPLIGMAVPSGEWRQIAFQIGNAKFLVGDFIGSVLDFVIIAFVVFLIGKAFLKPAPTPETKTCPECLEVIASAAKRCKYCTATV